jgi:hypothetical protein
VIYLKFLSMDFANEPGIAPIFRICKLRGPQRTSGDWPKWKRSVDGHCDFCACNSIYGKWSVVTNSSGSGLRNCDGDIARRFCSSGIISRGCADILLPDQALVSPPLKEMFFFITNTLAKSVSGSVYCSCLPIAGPHSEILSLRVLEIREISFGLFSVFAASIYF